jgi:hypothetical protein
VPDYEVPEPILNSPYDEPGDHWNIESHPSVKRGRGAPSPGTRVACLAQNPGPFLSCADGCANGADEPAVAGLTAQGKVSPH